MTNATWEHFWLNEGWTRWLECRIQAKLEGERTGDPAAGEALYNFLMQDASSHLVDAIKTFGDDSPLTLLVPDLEGIDPDDAFSAVPYEKGISFLNHLTDVVGGRAPFEDFARAYIAEFSMRTVTSDEFRTFFVSYCTARDVDASGVDWDLWFFAPGMPPVDTFDLADTLGEQCVQLVERWMAEHAGRSGGFEAAEFTDWPSKLQIHFLDTLQSRCAAAETPPLSTATLEKMDALYGLSALKNSEMRFRWQRVCMRHRVGFIVPHVIDFLKAQGRMKFVRPLFRDLYAWDAQRDLAVSTFREWKQYYHPICAKMLAQDLKLQDE